MAEMGPVIGRELSTYPQAPTIRTSVETDDINNDSGASTSKAREEGESERGKPIGAVDSAWARALMSAEACKRGVCAYKNPDAPRDGRAAANGCDGYHASRGLEGDRPVIRWLLCPRHRAWWAAERIRRGMARRSSRLSGERDG